VLEHHFPEGLGDLAALAREVAVKRVAPLVRDTERSRSFSPRIREILAEVGFFGLVVPERFGGVSADVRAEAVVVEEIAKVYPSAATYLTAHWTSSKMLIRAAEAGQDDEWLVAALAKIADGEWLGALGATEPEAGSDLAHLRSRAEKVNGEWVLNGGKRFITNGGVADFYAIIARSGGEGASGISVFCAEADRSGIEATRLESKMGLHGSATAEIVLKDLHLPADHLIGDEGKGFGMLMAGLDAGRVTVAAMSAGIAAGALGHAINYARDRRQFGQAIAEFQGVQFLLADMEIAVTAARALTMDAAEAVALGHSRASQLASIAKTYASDAAMQVTTDAVQVHGGYGYIDEYPVEMLMRDAKIGQIYEGTNQLQRSLIARRTLRDGLA
jgi:alkylation response protein AidB-like acyl-CoA dehydrogenase